VAQALSNPSAIARRDMYGYFGTPTTLFDGGSAYVGSANVEAEYRSRLEARRAMGALLSVEANASTGGSRGNTATVNVTVTLAPGETVPSPEQCRVRVALFEEGVIQCCDTEGGNVFPHVGRFLSEGVPLDLSVAGMQQLAEEIALGSWEPANLRAVAFVQRVTDHDVLNSSPAVPVEPTSVDTLTWGRIKALHR
jgi:hypothetical protein